MYPPATGAWAPAPSVRPGSATWADLYGQVDFGPNTVTAGSGGTRRIAAADAAADAGNPLHQGLTPDFLRQPAGILLVAVGVLLVLSLID